MNLVPKMPADEALAAAAGHLAQPACIFDVEGCQLLAANEAGHLLWGTEGRPPPPLALDAAMPGLVQLRSFAGSVAEGEVGPETLAFWTWRGLLSMPCVYRRVSLQHARATVLVMWPPTATSRRQHQVEQSVLEAAPADVATLRQIARRVRDRSDATGKQADQGGKFAAPTHLDLTVPGQREHDADTQARLAHELRTPLGAVIALAETMTEEHFGPLPNERYREYIRDIQDSARHALAVVEGMLERRDDADERLELAFAEIDLDDTVEACVATIRPLAEKAGLTLSILLSDGMPNVIADRRCLKQILLNLLSNCVKYAGTGAEVRVSSGYEPAGPVWIEVADSGPGIPADVVARTMDAAHDGIGGDAAAAGRRTGLGLPLSRQLARANGARLELTGTTGKGTCVRIVFGKDRAIPV